MIPEIFQGRKYAQIAEIRSLRTAQNGIQTQTFSIQKAYNHEQNGRFQKKGIKGNILKEY
jgi:uncharacterized protein YggE